MVAEERTATHSYHLIHKFGKVFMSSSSGINNESFDFNDLERNTDIKRPSNRIAQPEIEKSCKTPTYAHFPGRV